jgi:uncharacterized integral membrane protein
MAVRDRLTTGKARRKAAMKALLKFFILAPIAILLLAFAFANRHIVTVSFDPFAADDGPAFAAISAPLFLLLFLAAMVGVLAGGAVTWLRQGKHRRAARVNRAEAERLRGQARSPANDSVTSLQRRA